MSQPAHARRIVTIAAAAMTFVLLGAAAAQAHVRVFSQEPAVQGATDVALTFRVPTEENSNTVKVAVAIPTSTPLLSVLTQPKAGWSVAVVTSELPKPAQTDDGPVTDVVSEVTWTATAGGIAPGSYEDFALDAGVLPSVAQVAFPTVQTYANGDVVRWIEPTPAGGDEPDHPVPVLDLVTAQSTVTTTPAVAAKLAHGSASTDTVSRALSIAALAVAALVLLAAGSATIWRRVR